jgi:hypothetical protein
MNNYTLYAYFSSFSYDVVIFRDTVEEESLCYKTRHEVIFQHMKSGSPDWIN